MNASLSADLKAQLDEAAVAHAVLFVGGHLARHGLSRGQSSVVVDN
jgi:hypothetical protein